MGLIKVITNVLPDKCFDNNENHPSKQNFRPLSDNTHAEDVVSEYNSDLSEQLPLQIVDNSTASTENSELFPANQPIELCHDACTNTPTGGQGVPKVCQENDTAAAGRPKRMAKPPKRYEPESGNWM